MKKKRKEEPIHETVTHASPDPDTLFEISGEIKVIMREITEAQAEKDYELVDTLTDELLDLMDKHENKYERYVHVIKNALNSATGNKEIADIFQAKATALNNLAKRLKETILRDMEQLNLVKVDAGIFTIRTQRNSIPTLTVEIDPEDLDERFQIIEPNKEELRFAISNGEEVDGVTLEKGYHTRIGPKS